MADTTLPALLGTGTHAARPAAGDVGSGALYSCTDHDLIYQSDGSSWSTWADLTGSVAALGAWTDYTPAVTATTTNPTLGSSTVEGRYKALDANTYIVKFALTIVTGGAWNAGSGEYQFSLPAGVTANDTMSVGSITVLDGGTARYAGICMVAHGSTVIHPLVVGDATGDRVLKHNVPVTWATGDGMWGTVLVEAA